MLDSKTSLRIFNLAKVQQEELEERDEDGTSSDEDEKDRQHAAYYQVRSTVEGPESEDDIGGNSGDEFLETEEYPELVGVQLMTCAFSSSTSL